jgi:hypothetical protein
MQGNDNLTNIMMRRNLNRPNVTGPVGGNNNSGTGNATNLQS